MTGGSTRRSDFDLDGTVAFITGGASGLGLQHAVAFARAGADVSILDVHRYDRSGQVGTLGSTGEGAKEDLDLAVERVKATGVRALGCYGDVRKQEDLERAVAATLEELGRIDVLVANAGISLHGSSCTTRRTDWDRLFEVNVTGAWQSCKAVVPHMIEQESGRIILTSSVAALRPRPSNGPYAASKAAVIAFGRSLALEVAQYGITVNSICPTTVETPTSRKVAEDLGLSWEEWLDASVQAQAIQEIVGPDDISNAVLFLASENARFITGVVLPVDAGMTIKLPEVRLVARGAGS